MKAINSRWPQSSVHACFFHLTQNVYRQVQKAGFTTKYGNDEEYAHAVRMLPALAFSETNDIYSAFEDIGDLQISDLDPLYNYFEDYYIDGEISKISLISSSVNSINAPYISPHLMSSSCSYITSSSFSSIYSNSPVLSSSETPTRTGGGEERVKIPFEL
ncbi:unnamed protein product [Rotaria sp. Silwood2]|nr:unnamed protein product [Rotaria sp. Silwood2]CAF4196040.1 unnamed protein product [Rotaria sp. Silwood2]